MEEGGGERAVVVGVFVPIATAGGGAGGGDGGGAVAGVEGGGEGVGGAVAVDRGRDRAGAHGRRVPQLRHLL